MEDAATDFFTPSHSALWPE